MALTDAQLEFLRSTRSAAMITVGADGLARSVRVGVAMVDGRLWSSGTRARARTTRLRRDPRCTLFVFDPGYLWLTLETTVTILDGPDAPELSLRLFREMQGRPTGPLSWFGAEHDDDTFRQLMVDEARVVYEFGIDRAYGMVSAPG